MEVVILSGGLGNQMFQYAFYLTKIAKNRNIYLSDYSIRRESVHNGFELERLFGISLSRRMKVKELIVRIIRKCIVFENHFCLRYLVKLCFILFKLLGINIVREQEMGMYEASLVHKQVRLTFYFGFWQSEKYFIHNQSIIREKYHFNGELSVQTMDILLAIQSTNSVSVHIRRGDYLMEQHKMMYGNICTIEYYQKAISYIIKSISDSSFFVFSDDINWAKTNLQIPNAVYVDWNKGFDSWQDMYLMSQCKHNIIANSTFSWWGAWLNQNENKVVIAPSKFLNTHSTPDLIPDSWIKI